MTARADLPSKLREAFHRARHTGDGDYNPDGDLFDVAADEIERLRAVLSLMAQSGAVSSEHIGSNGRVTLHFADKHVADRFIDAILAYGKEVRDAV